MSLLSQVVVIGMAFYILASSLCTHHRAGCLMYIQVKWIGITKPMNNWWVFLSSASFWISLHQTVGLWIHNPWAVDEFFIFNLFSTVFASYARFFFNTFLTFPICGLHSEVHIHVTQWSSSWVVHKSQHHVISMLSLEWLSWLVKCAVAPHICPAAYIIRIPTLCKWQLTTLWSAQHVSLKHAPLLHTGMLGVMAACISPTHWTQTSEAKDTIL